jgi:hypothetical protein
MGVSSRQAVALCDPIHCGETQDPLLADGLHVEGFTALRGGAFDTASTARAPAGLAATAADPGGE